MRDSTVPAFNYNPFPSFCSTPNPPKGCQPLPNTWRSKKKEEEEKEKRRTEALDSATDGKPETHLRRSTAQAISMVN